MVWSNELHGQPCNSTLRYLQCLVQELRCCSLKMHSFCKLEFVVSSMFPKMKKAVKLFLLNCLIFKVDQLGLEPRTSRL